MLTLIVIVDHSQMAVAGLYSVDYRIVCACRNGNVYSIKNGELSGSVIELESMPCGLVSAPCTRAASNPSTRTLASPAHAFQSNAVRTRRDSLIWHILPNMAHPS
eukprot:3324259-Prymnesium_polylepis.1